VESRIRWEWHRINVLGEHENVEHVVDETHESPNFKAISTTIGGRGILSTLLILMGKWRRQTANYGLNHARQGTSNVHK
jgi:hypothetical protein